MTAEAMPRVVTVISDLLFSSKVTATGKALGIETRVVSTAEALVEALCNETVRLVIVDMGLPEAIARESLRAAATHPTQPATVAYFPHVESALAEAARQAGASIVLPRSRFSAELPDILTRFAGEPPRPEAIEGMR